MSENSKGTNPIPSITLFVALLNAIILLTLAGVVGNMRQELGTLRGEIATLQEVSQNNVQVMTPSAILDEECTSCHADRRFLSEHGSAATIQRVLQRMEAMPDAHISITDRDKIHNALLLMKCQGCHSEEVFSRLATLNEKERQRTVLQMWEHSGTTMSRQELLDILKAYDQIQGF